MPRDLPKTYDPAAIEDRWAQYWVTENIFHQPPASDAPNFTMLLPPPNITGRLHMGHMLNQTEMDILARWRRMCGDRTLWIPGTDHASIATQMMVERQLLVEGTTRQAIGRELFLDRVWEWKKQYGGAIQEQMKRLGASVDWSREYFTMDEDRSRSVTEAFVRLYEQGLIYRGTYIVNWCPSCQTAISDLEVIHEEQHGKLWEIRYPVVGETESITVATTRPETMLGDVAVAVHPDDERYRRFHGKRLVLPLTGREIPVITDPWVSRDFGTGAVKITPAHDANDFATGQRHGLPSIDVMDETGHMNAQAGAYQGLDRFEARKRVLEDLEKQGLLGVTREHLNSIGKCQRSNTIVEPRLSKQWFVRIQPLADRAIEAVEQGYIRFTPEQYAKTYFEWMRNIHDWCISRQLWWGQRIPAWRCRSCNREIVARQTPETCPGCGSGDLEQETDVLDTWFSSGLLPFSVLGWPDRAPDLNTLYPTQLLVTGSDILFFWVARMVMLGCHFMLDEPAPGGGKRTLKDAVPFREVYIHALVRDAERQKMSKTKGNVIDPIETVRQFGTDAVRFTLAAMASPGTDIAFSEERTSGYRAFANKIWNASRFLFLQLDRAAEAGITLDLAATPADPGIEDSANLEDRWIAARLNKTALEINQALAAYRFHEAANVIYQFFWGDFCDWYLEIVKLRLDFSDPARTPAARAALTALVGIFEPALRLLSPFMPFLTEEIWHALHSGNPPAKSIALSRFPLGRERTDASAEIDMNILQELIVTVRALRKDLGVEEGARVPIELCRYSIPDDCLAFVKRLARVSDVTGVSRLPEGANSRGALHFDVAVLYERKVDVAAERERLTKDLARFEKEASGAKVQLKNERFLSKAPAEVVAGLRRRSGELGVLIPKTRAALDALNAGKQDESGEVSKTR